jgi:hypothetical protein
MLTRHVVLAEHVCHSRRAVWVVVPPAVAPGWRFPEHWEREVQPPLHADPEVHVADLELPLGRDGAQPAARAKPGLGQQADTVCLRARALTAATPASACASCFCVSAWAVCSTYTEPAPDNSPTDSASSSASRDTTMRRQAPRSAAQCGWRAAERLAATRSPASSAGSRHSAAPDGGARNETVRAHPPTYAAGEASAAETKPRPPSRIGRRACCTASRAAATHSAGSSASVADPKQSRSSGPRRVFRQARMCASCAAAACWIH